MGFQFQRDRVHDGEAEIATDREGMEADIGSCIQDSGLGKRKWHCAIKPQSLLFGTYIPPSQRLTLLKDA